MKGCVKMKNRQFNRKFYLDLRLYIVIFYIYIFFQRTIFLEWTVIKILFALLILYMAFDVFFKKEKM